MILTPENYYSNEANWAYFSTSQIKTFADCPARAMAELRGEYVRPDTTALLVGSYVDAYFEGTLSEFVRKHPELFKRDGTLKAEYAHANVMIERAEADPVFMEYMQGEKQVIRTGEIDGFPFKIKADVLHPERIVDLKTCRSLNAVYKEGEGKLTFAEAYGYTLQMAIYREIEGHSLPAYLACITKETPPDICVIEIPSEVMNTELEVLKQNLPLYDAIKQGVVPEERCGKCEYCRSTKKLSGPISLHELDGGW